MPKALQSVGLLVDLHPHVREPALAIGDLSHQLVPARLGIAHEREYRDDRYPDGYDRDPYGYDDGYRDSYRDRY